MLALSNKAATIAREAVQKTQEQQPIKKAPKKGGKDWLDEMVTKQEIIDRVGIIDPIIQPKIESTLSSMSYAGRSKMEVTNDLVEDLEKQVEKLKFQRVKMLQVRILITIPWINLIPGTTKGASESE
jgi:polyhydroxyalkanoate synthesis regulator phasin